MKKQVLIFTFLFLFINDLVAQNPNYRIMFKYQISYSRLKDLQKFGYDITDAAGNKYNLCPSLKGPFKTLISSKDGALILDPWSITDSRTNTLLKKTTTDPCYGNSNIINANTDNTLRIELDLRPKVGSPTIPLRVHYRTLILGINAIGLKLRPKVKDYNGNTYTANATTGNISLGLSAGYSLGWTYFSHRSSNSYSFTPGVALGFSSASLSKEILKKVVTTTFNTNNFIYSPALSLTVARNDIGFIFSYGKDLMTGKNSDAWAYQGKRFFGFGISAGLKL